jgi:hypothetical protein
VSKGKHWPVAEMKKGNKKMNLIDGKRQNMDQK